MATPTLEANHHKRGEPCIQAIRGMRDILPAETIYWRHLEKHLVNTALSYGYQEIRLPIVEKTALFKRSIGEATDIVEKEMYTFLDKNQDSLTLRPEGTAVCVRAGIEHGLFYNQTQRLWYLGPMFRHERPQKGRYRQFHQFGIEALGMSGPLIEAEMILMSSHVWEKLGLTNQVTLQLNSLGTAESRAVYRQQLVDYFTAHIDQLDEDSLRRLTTNPLRILDSKNPDIQLLIAQAPNLNASLDEASVNEFQQLQSILNKANIHYELNPRLVRGLDYYNGTVFEWINNETGSQNAICSGGRYDSLVGLLGGKPTPAVGFALGMERVISLLETQLLLQKSADIYLISMETASMESQAAPTTTQMMLLAKSWRLKYPHIHFITDLQGGSFKNQFKRADKSGTRFAFILGQDELNNQTITIKFLREEKPQISLAWHQIDIFLKELSV